MDSFGFVGATALACSLVSMLAWLTWRRRLARRALLLGIASGMAFLLPEGHQIEGSTWLPALLGSLGLIAVVALCVDLAMAVKARRVRLLFRMLIPGFSSWCTVFHFLEIDRRCWLIDLLSIKNILEC